MAVTARRPTGAHFEEQPLALRHVSLRIQVRYFSCHLVKVQQKHTCFDRPAGPSRPISTVNLEVSQVWFNRIRTTTSGTSVCFYLGAMEVLVGCTWFRTRWSNSAANNSSAFSPCRRSGCEDGRPGGQFSC